MNGHVQDIFVDILVSYFHCDRQLCSDHLDQKLTLEPFMLQGFDLVYLMLFVEQAFGIRFTEEDVLHFGLETPRLYLEKIQAHLT